jgi:hypothetical protein
VVKAKPVKPSGAGLASFMTDVLRSGGWTPPVSMTMVYWGADWLRIPLNSDRPAESTTETTPSLISINTGSSTSPREGPPSSCRSRPGGHATLRSSPTAWRRQSENQAHPIATFESWAIPAPSSERTPSVVKIVATTSGALLGTLSAAGFSRGHVRLVTGEMV